MDSVDTRVDKKLSFIAPALCALDGFCAKGCGTNSVIVDPDCSAAKDGGNSTGGSGGSGASGDGGRTPGSGGSGGIGAGLNSAAGGAPSAATL